MIPITQDMGYTVKFAQERLTWLEDRRRVRRLVDQGCSDEEIREQSGVEPRLIRRALSSARRRPQNLTTSPQEVIDRYIVGELNRQEVIDRLCAMPYTFNKAMGYDRLFRGTWSDVRDAHYAGILDSGAVKEIISRGHVRGDWNPLIENEVTSS